MSDTEKEAAVLHAAMNYKTEEMQKKLQGFTLAELAYLSLACRQILDGIESEQTKRRAAVRAGVADHQGRPKDGFSQWKQDNGW